MTLKPGQVGAQRGSERLRENGLADTGYVFYQEVAAAQCGDGNRGEGTGCAEDDVPEVRHERLPERYRCSRRAASCAAVTAVTTLLMSSPLPVRSSDAGKCTTGAIGVTGADSTGGRGGIFIEAPDGGGGGSVPRRMESGGNFGRTPAVVVGGETETVGGGGWFAMGVPIGGGAGASSQTRSRSNPLPSSKRRRSKTARRSSGPSGRMDRSPGPFP